MYAEIAYRMFGDTVSLPGQPLTVQLHSEAAYENWMQAAAESETVEYVIDDIQFA